MGPSGSERLRRSEVARGEKRKPIRVWLLGGFRVSIGSRTIPQDAWHLRKAAILVKLLALALGHRMHREQAMDLLWSDSGRKAASNSLRSTLHAARKVIDPAMGSRYLASEDESLVLCPEGDLWVDVDAFEQGAARSRGPRSLRPSGQHWTYTRAIYFLRTATRSGQKVGATSCDTFTLPCSSNSRGYTKNVMSMSWPSRYCVR